MTNYKRHTITAALPYVNSPVHIGHLAGCHLPADTYSRYLRACGEDVLFLCGSDEHGVAIMLKAMQEGISPQELIDKYHHIIKKSFEDFGISFDIYSRTSNALHHETASQFFKEVYDKGGVLDKKSSIQFYDVEHKQFLADRYIIGICPNCDFDGAYGDQCEKCGTSLSPELLINPRSALSGNPPEKRETSHWYLQLQSFQTWLEEWLLVEHKDWKPNVIGQCRSWLNQGLQERSVTRDMDWGVKVPLPDAEGKVLYVWFDAPLGYITAAKEWAALHNKDWVPYWKDKEGTRLIHFLGKDNIVFHCIIFPVMLKAHGEYVLPDNVPANEFLNLEGEKISSSRNWAVWLHEYLIDFPNKQDVLRYVLTANAPESKDNDFSWKDFQNRNNNELVATFGNFVNRALVLTHNYYKGVVPQYGELTEVDKMCIAEMKAVPQKIMESMDTFRFREALAELMNLARLGNKYLAEQEPWKLIKNPENAERVQTILYISLEISAYLAMLSQPFLPNTSKALLEMLNLEPANWKTGLDKQLIHPGHTISQAKLLFEKIEDDAIQKQIDKLHATRKAVVGGAPAAMVGVSPTIPEIKENISFEDFIKMDLRMATILEAEKVKGADKLLQLKIDIGTEVRTIVSGIAEYYKPEDIIGRQACIVANLAPRKIKGIESKGMILMISDSDGKLVFLNPEVGVGAGSVVK